MASIKDVAQRAGVSISTVSNVINGTKPVSDELVAKVHQAIEELNYEVNPVARSLKSKRTTTLGVVITNINRIFFPQVIKGIQDAVSGYGFNITFCDTDDQPAKEKAFIQMLKSNWVDGIILDSVVGTQDEEYFQMLRQLGSRKKRIPVVSLERKLDEMGIDSVIVDNEEGGRMAARHLLDCGCKSIAHITGPLYSSMGNDRLRGCQEELAKNGITLSQIQEGDFSPLSGYQAMDRLLMEGKRIDGVFAANDQMAIGALKALRERGFRVPDDIRVVGFDNTFVASIVDPSLTTIHVPKYRMGVEAVEQLMKRNNGETGKPVVKELPIHIIVRQSTDKAGRKDWDLQKW
ncbi:MAG: LacI family DNA-binding transcriptional regulator [Clostridia bacterium]